VTLKLYSDLLVLIGKKTDAY